MIGSLRSLQMISLVMMSVDPLLFHLRSTYSVYPLVAFEEPARRSSLPGVRDSLRGSTIGGH